LEDGHSESTVKTLTSGASSDLIGQISTSRAAGGGLYSPYVGAIVDVFRMLDNFHTAGYQYIPALGVPSQDELNLKLNNPPSFRKPKSVLVISLPPVEQVPAPSLRALKTNDSICLQKPGLLLSVEGAPLVFSSELAHDFTLQVKNKAGEIIDLPAKADPNRGGFSIDTSKITGTTFGSDLQGQLQGHWGFKPFNGPTFRFWNAQPGNWSFSPGDSTALIVGRSDVIHLHSENATCVSDINFKNQQGKEFDTVWKQTKANEIEVQLLLKDEAAGPATLLVEQFGLTEPDKLSLQTYSEAGRLDEFRINAGDTVGTLKGTRLDEVTRIDAKGISFIPTDLTRADGRDELKLQGAQSAKEALQSGEIINALVTLKDGRTQPLKMFVDLPRPKVALVSKSVEPGPTATTVHLGSVNQLPLDGTLSFFLKSEVPATFQRNEKIEVASEDGLLTTTLSIDDGSLVLEDAQSVLARFNPLKSFGESAFGPLHFRAVQTDGRKGDWQPLVTLVRVPSLTDVHCTSVADEPCTLNGTNLFLIDSIATTADFSDPVSVPMGITTNTVTAPRPTEPVLYIKLRDEPAVVSTATLPSISKFASSLLGRRKKSQ